MQASTYVCDYCDVYVRVPVQVVKYLRTPDQFAPHLGGGRGHQETCPVKQANSLVLSKREMCLEGASQSDCNQPAIVAGARQDSAGWIALILKTILYSKPAPGAWADQSLPHAGQRLLMQLLAALLLTANAIAEQERLSSSVTPEV